VGSANPIDSSRNLISVPMKHGVTSSEWQKST